MNIKNNKNCKITINDEVISGEKEGTIINSNGLCINNNNTSLEKTSEELFDDLGLWLERETPFDFEVKNDDDKVIKFNKERREIV